MTSTMSSSVWQSVYVRIVVGVLGVTLFLLLVFFTYNSESVPTYGLSLISPKPPANCSRQGKDEEELIILIWMWPFGSKFGFSCAHYDITGCHLTDDKALYSKAHAVMFHHRNIDLNTMPKEPRPYFQKWVWYNLESPSNTAKIPALNDLFNLTCSYRRDSDVLTPYGSLVPISEEDGLFTRVPTKERLVCWIVSNWNLRYKRIQYYNELKKHIEIKTYGRAFGEYISNDKYIEIMTSCKFYLSFENSIHKDYITEKFFRPMEYGAVPVVLGPPRQNYEIHAPGHAFIHVDDFPSPKELAERLKHLDQHPDEYMDFFEWRNSFKAVSGRFGLEQTCRTCHYLKKQKRYQVFRDLNKWFWE
uniref:Fucosyltransferase n=1 Tax=Neogobius melanostomus TaxID=47308 RepID=A0A8C6WP23_9GOBI